MNVAVIGCSFRDTAIELRERLAFNADQLCRALDELNVRYSCEAVILSTCNRVEVYLARIDPGLVPDADLIAEFLAEVHEVSAAKIRPHLHEWRQDAALRHLFRVAASLDSMLVGEGQIAGQVKRAYELAQERSSAGPLLHAMFQHANQAAKRVRAETGIARGHVSVSSAAVDYVRQVFSHFGDKTILVIGAGKMGELTLRHLQELRPRRILVTNRSPEKAELVASGCGGTALPWDQLDEALAQADIVLSTTGASEPIMTQQRFQGVLARRSGGTMVILDIAVPRDFEPGIHDGDRTCLFNIDDLKRIREQTLEARKKHIAPAEALVEAEVQRFVREWARRRNGPIIAALIGDLEAKRRVIVQQVMQKLNGRLSDEDRKFLEGAFRLLQNQFLHGPISALTEATQAGTAGHTGHTLLDALRKLFHLEES
jgi:glutamyl-tRNA reductase